MTSQNDAPIRSPSYPSMSLRDAVAAVAKIEKLYRSNPVDRQVAAKLLGYSSLSGPANKSLASLAHFGLLERAGKGEARVTPRARAILHADNDQEMTDNLLAAALEPHLFRELMERFEGIPVPPEDGVITYLNRQGFNPNSVRPAAKAFLQTMSYMEEVKGSESHSIKSFDNAESHLSVDTESSYGGARVGDLVQWEQKGVLRFEKPLRVRFVSEDKQWVAVEGSRTGIPMSEVIVDTPAQHQPAEPPIFDFEEPRRSAGFEEWFRAKVGSDKQVMISYRGEDELGAREIQKLIDILEAQKKALED